MKRLFILCGLVLAFGAITLVVAEVAQAQAIPFLQPDSSDDAGWQKGLSEIKKNTENLTKENARLSEESESLKAGVDKAQGSIENIQKDSTESAAKIKETRAFLIEQKDKVQSIQNDIEKLNKEISDLDGQNSTLEEELLTTSEGQRLWKLKSADLKAKKSSVDLDIKMEENANPQLKKTLEEIAQLEEKLAENKREEAQLDRMMEDDAFVISGLRDHADTLKAENARLNLESSDLDRKKAQAIKNKPEMKKEDQAAEKETNRLYLEKMKEKKDLENSITNLETQIEDVEKSIDGISQIQFKKRHLLDQIMSLDSENQTLRNQISELKKNLSDLKKDSEAEDAGLESAPPNAGAPKSGSAPQGRATH